MSNKYSFVGDTTYSLLLYLLYSTDEMLHNTTYYVGSNLSPCKLEPKIVMPPLKSYSNSDRIKYRLKCLKYRVSLRKSSIFAQDHLFFSAPLIDNLQYTVLEDCPNFFSVLYSHVPKEPSFTPSLGAYVYNFKVGRIFNRYGGYNPWCKKRIVTTDSDRKLFEKLKLTSEQISLENLWRTSSEFKQKYIKNVYALHNLEHLSSKRIVLFSQPLIEDAHLSNEEFVSIYKPYIDKYGAENILVKLHPRDKFDYTKYFPGITTLQTKAPQQLLSAMGLKFNIAITVCSSAVSSMDKDCKIVWIGAEIDDRIVKAYGHVKSPKFY